MSDKLFEIEEDDSTVTFTDAGDVLPVDPDPILKLRNERDEARLDAEELRKACAEKDEDIQQLNHGVCVIRYERDEALANLEDLRNKLKEAQTEADYLRQCYSDSCNRAADARNEAERYQMVLREEKYAAERQLNDLKAEMAVKDNAIGHLAESLSIANNKLAQVAGLHDLLERLTISADDRARKNAMEIVVSDVKHLGWNIADLKLQASLQLGLSEAYDRTNAAICDILAGATSWEEDNWS